jgi:hypothetical protein
MVGRLTLAKCDLGYGLLGLMQKANLFDAFLLVLLLSQALKGLF